MGACSKHSCSIAVRLWLRRQFLERKLSVESRGNPGDEPGTTPQTEAYPPLRPPLTPVPLRSTRQRRSTRSPLPAQMKLSPALPPLSGSTWSPLPRQAAIGSERRSEIPQPKLRQIIRESLSPMRLGLWQNQSNFELVVEPIALSSPMNLLGLDGKRV